MKNIFRIKVEPKNARFDRRYFTYLVLADTLEEALKAINQFDEFDILATQLITECKVSEIIYRESY